MLVEMVVREILESADNRMVVGVLIVGTDQRVYLGPRHRREDPADSTRSEHHIGIEEEQDRAVRGFGTAVTRG